MINNENLKKRDLYLNQLIAFQDKEQIKVITGIRRSGKSKLLLLMIKHLLDEGKSKEQIIEMHFEKMDFSLMTYKEVYDYVKSSINEENMNLASYKRIKQVIVRDRDFIRTTTGKIKRKDNMGDYFPEGMEKPEL